MYGKMWNLPRNCRFGVVRFQIGYNPLQRIQVGSEPNLEPNQQLRAIGNTIYGVQMGNRIYSTNSY